MKLYHKKAFTLIELLVVIAIIAILAAILFPVFAQAKGAAKQASSVSNVKQVTMAQFLYLNDFDGTVAMNRDCNISPAPGQPFNVFCVAGRGMRGWIDLVVPYVKNYGVFKSPQDGVQPVRMPVGTLHWDGTPLAPDAGLIWGARVVSGVYTPLGGDFRSSYGRNNNFANNGQAYTANENQIQFPSSTILIFSHTANSGAGAAGNEGVSGSAFSIVRRGGIQADSATCQRYGVGDVNQNNRASFLPNLPTGGPQERETRLPASERYNGRGIYGFADGHAKAYVPDQVRGQCNWGDSRGVELGNDGTRPDFRF